MHRVKLNPHRVGEGKVVDLAHATAKCCHLRGNPKLRDGGQREHPVEQKVSQRERMEFASRKARVQHRADQKHDPGNDSHPMQDVQGTADDVAGQMPCWQHRRIKDRRSEDKGKEDEAAHPDDQGEKNQEAKNRQAVHLTGGIIASAKTRALSQEAIHHKGHYVARRKNLRLNRDWDAIHDFLHELLGLFSFLQSRGRDRIGYDAVSEDWNDERFEILGQAEVAAF